MNNVLMSYHDWKIGRQPSNTNFHSSYRSMSNRFHTYYIEDHFGKLKCYFLIHCFSICMGFSQLKCAVFVASGNRFTCKFIPTLIKSASIYDGFVFMSVTVRRQIVHKSLPIDVFYTFTSNFCNLLFNKYNWIRWFFY